MTANGPPPREHWGFARTPGRTRLTATPRENDGPIDIRVLERYDPVIDLELIAGVLSYAFDDNEGWISLGRQQAKHDGARATLPGQADQVGELVPIATQAAVADSEAVRRRLQEAIAALARLRRPPATRPAHPPDSLAVQLEYLRGAVAEAVGYELAGDADADDAQLVDRLHALVGPTAPGVNGASRSRTAAETIPPIAPGAVTWHPLRPSRSLAIELLEQRCAALEAERDRFQAHNSELVLKRQAAEEQIGILDRAGQAMALDLRRAGEELAATRQEVRDNVSASVERERVDRVAYRERLGTLDAKVERLEAQVRVETHRAEEFRLELELARKASPPAPGAIVVRFEAGQAVYVAERADQAEGAVAVYDVQGLSYHRGLAAAVGDAQLILARKP